MLYHDEYIDITTTTTQNPVLTMPARKLSKTPSFGNT